MRTLLLFIISLTIVLPGMISAKQLGPNVSTYNGEELKWEEGSRNYFVMFKSLLKNTDPSNDNSNGIYNPQADECMNDSEIQGFQLNASHIPDDAHVHRAFLVWNGAALLDNLYGVPDKMVNLEFSHSQFTYSETITGDRDGSLVENGDFSFEGFLETDGGTGDSRGFFTYRTDITDFFNTIHDEAAENGISIDGDQLRGTYKLTGLSCTNDPAYLNRSVLVSGWSIVLIYTSESISPKKIYLYDGFHGYQHETAEINVSGFEFPNRPEVRLTLLVAEGDPGNVSTAFGGGSDIPEGLSIRGSGKSDWQLMSNKCNPFQNLNGFEYTEVYNSISSIYGYNTDIEECIGGQPPNINPAAMEYAMDVDTFVLNSEKSPWSEHFGKGDTQFSLKVGANQDWIMTNFMIVSVDTKAPKWDIPLEREKVYCSCSENADSVCFDHSFYYSIKIQNWGDKTADNVRVRDTLSQYVDYIPGTTKLYTFKDEKWSEESISDASGGEFPLSEFYKVADTLEPCNKNTNECSEKLVVLFKVRPKDDVPKHKSIDNMAEIIDEGGGAYNTNSSVPLRLKSGTCPSPTACENPDLTACKPEISDNGGNGDKKNFGSDTKVSYALGRNSISIKNNIIVPSGSTKVNIGQFSLYGDNAEDDVYFSLDEANLSFDLGSTDIYISNITLYNDVDGDGIISSEDTVAGTTDSLKNSVARITINGNSQMYEVNKLHYFIVAVDVDYSAQEVPMNTSFSATLGGDNAVYVHDDGNASVTASRDVIFANVMIEPTTTALEYIIFSTEDAKISVPYPSDMKGEKNVMLFRMKAVNSDNGLTQLTLKREVQSTAEVTYVGFDEAFSKLELWDDTNGDGNPDNFIAKGEIETNRVIFKGLNISAPQDVDKHLAIVGKFSIDNNKGVQFSINKDGVLRTNSTATVVGLPIYSKRFEKICPEGDPICGSGSGSDGEGCGCDIISSEKTNYVHLSGFVLAFLILMIFRHSISTYKKD